MDKDVAAICESDHESESLSDESSQDDEEEVKREQHERGPSYKISPAQPGPIASAAEPALLRNGALLLNQAHPTN